MYHYLYIYIYIYIHTYTHMRMRDGIHTAQFYFSGVHEDYHQPTDTAEKILYEPYKRRVKLIFHTAWELANRDDKISLNKQKYFILID